MKITKFGTSFFINFLSKGHERSLNTKRNITASLLLKGIGLFITLALVPATINYVNPVNYGIWLTLSSIINYVSFFDLGLGNGLRNRLTEAIARNDVRLARTYVSTTYAFLIIIITIIFGIFLVVNTWLDWSKILNTKPEMAYELSLLATIVFGFFGFQFVFQLINTVLTASQQPARAGFLLMMANLLTLVVILILLKFTHGNMIYLALVMGGSPSIVFLIASLFLYQKKYANYRPSAKYVDFSCAWSLMSLGLQFFVIQAMFLIIFSTSNIIITQLFGPEDVTRYNIAQRYFSVLISVFTIILTPLWSAFTDAFIKKDMIWIHKSIRAMIKIWMIFSAGALFMTIIAGFSYRIWIGSSITIPAGITILMGIYAILFNWTNLFAYFLNGIGKIRLQLIISVIFGVLSIPLMIIAGKSLGVVGVIMVTCLIVFVLSILLPIQSYKILKGKALGVWNM